MLQGQLQPTGQLLEPESRSGAGRALVEIQVTDDPSTYHLPGGSVAQVAIYSDRWPKFALLRKILLRMKSWENYIFVEGHRSRPSPTGGKADRLGRSAGRQENRTS